ncbi:hypothetical protein FISHEDRAFT_6708, partial [Fistulina hepatica ATCC 64428]
MTRITNFGRKRTYLQAGFSQTADAVSPAQSVPDAKKPKIDAGGSKPVPNDKKYKSHRPKKMEKISRRNQAKGTRDPSATKRLKRIKARDEGTTCFACREKGHAAKDCPNTQASEKAAIGVCYRCGSTKHTLSRCKQLSDPNNPLPFATCFICKEQGHLVSACPQNVSHGIYPNGGCCKLCGENTHLARDCQLRKPANNSTAVVGISETPGADEDDFHTLKRISVDVQRDEK